MKRAAWLAGMVFLGATGAGQAQTCMVAPTAKQEVSGRFGKFRAGGAANFGSGNARPHMHDGLDFSTNGVSAPVLATLAGTVSFAGSRGSAGNAVIIRAADGRQAAFYHLSSIDKEVRVGKSVSAGQAIGLSGRTGMREDGAVHLHFVMGVPNAGDARAKAFAADVAQRPAFNPGQLPSALSNTAFGYATDPSPHFCQSFPIQDDGLHRVLGRTTMEQYKLLFEPPPGAGAVGAQFSAVQRTAAFGDALAAARSGGGSAAAVLSDAEGYGALPQAPMGGVETMSALEALATEARRRFGDARWNEQITAVGERALRADAVLARGVEARMNEAVAAKKQRVEALMAIYTAQRLQARKRELDERRRLAEMQQAAGLLR